MDLSEEYIKMCEKAGEVQGLWKHSKRNSGDCYFHKKLNKSYFVTEIDQEDSDCIWLPRQDQLQGLLHDNFSNRTPVALADKFNKFISAELGKSNVYSLMVASWSMEQLWLAFVMKENYNRIWSSEDWL